MFEMFARPVAGWGACQWGVLPDRARNLDMIIVSPLSRDQGMRFVLFRRFLEFQISVDLYYLLLEQV